MEETFAAPHDITPLTLSSVTHIKMPGRTRPIDKLATAAAKCSKEVCAPLHPPLLGPCTVYSLSYPNIL